MNIFIRNKNYKHNKTLTQINLHKHWINKFKTHFEQPANKTKRQNNRIEKAAATFPRPLNKLRPIVSSQTRKYAGKVRFGRGFTIAEIKRAGLSTYFARSVGITVGHRRTSISEEQLQVKVAKLN